MSKVKIVSNPYRKEISYYCWSAYSGDWKQITREENPNSGLISEDMTTFFFPFSVNRIVDEIIKEYKDEDGKVEILFEGTDDEFKDLSEVCNADEYKGIVNLVKSETYLENARDILPDIRDIFKNVKPLVDMSFSNTDKISGELNRFVEASEDKIPICILGNYSSGKSTLINSLIGREILPCGDEPITAKIYMIEKSEYADRANISFEYKNQDVKIRFDEQSFKFSFGNIDDSFIDHIKSKLSSITDTSITKMVNATIEMLNTYGADDDIVSDLIKIQIPFSEGILGQSSSEFVIFDTPGSNSASNDRHLKVLKKAMEGFTNGLPIYVSEYDSLDSTDNEKLYQVIRSMKELDDRFTMIIVNKADIARLPKGDANGDLTEDDEERILGLAIPKNLYKEGIFFVSSIMGLGAKTGGEFIDEHLAEIYEDQVNKYTDAGSRFYKRLYRYNIMPKQIKTRSVEISEKSANVVYANSGLLSMEQEIQTFASKYSPYNKCQQSHLFLSKVIQLTSNEIEDTKTERENFKQRISERLDRDKQDLMNGIESKGLFLEETYRGEYETLISDSSKELSFTLSLQQVKDLEADYITEQEAEHNMSELRSSAEDSKKEMYAHLKENLLKAIKKPSLAALKEVGTDFRNDQKQLTDSNSVVSTAQKDSYSQASDALIESVIIDFTNRLTEVKEAMEDRSEKFWEEKLAKIKDELALTVTESSTLSDERKEELKGIIFDYKDIVYDKSADEIFVRESFEKGLRFGKRIIVRDQRLNLEKISRKYNAEFGDSLAELSARIQENFEQSVTNWRERLVSLILNNIVEYNPTLHDQACVISETIQKIKELEERQIKLSRYTEDIRKMMEWKTE